MPNALAERGFAHSNIERFDEYIISLEWGKYGENLFYSLKGITNEKQTKYLKRLDCILEEIGSNMQIKDNRDLTFGDYSWKILFSNKKEFPSKSDVFSKFLSLVSNYCTEKAEKMGVDKSDALAGYKMTCNLIQNTRRAIKRVINNEPLYLIQQERNNFYHFANQLSYPPEKRY